MIFETWAFTKKCLPKNIWAVKNLIWYFIILKNSKCFEMKGENAQKLVMLFASAQGCQSAKLAKMRNCCPWFQFVLVPLVSNLSIKKIIYITIEFHQKFLQCIKKSTELQVSSIKVWSTSSHFQDSVLHITSKV